MELNLNAYKFASIAPNVKANSEAALLIDSASTLTRMAIDKYHKSNILSTQYSCSEDYNTLNEQVKKNIIQYCATKSNIGDMYDVNTKEGLSAAFSNPIFSQLFFAIQTETLKSVNADNEVEQIMLVANVFDVNVGDSKTFEIESKALFNIQENAYGNNTTRMHEQYKSPITVVPKPRIAGVSFDVTEMIAYNYDFGKQMAKIAMSFRAKMYQEVVDTIFAVANVSSTPFYSSTFAKTTYMEMADRLRGINNAEVTAYGTRVALSGISDTITTGYSTIDERNKTGFMADLYNVKTMILDQAVDSSLPTIPFRVPNDRVLLLSSVADRAVKLVKENSIRVIDNDGTQDSLYRRSYKYLTSWGTGLATQASYGIQEV